MSSRPDCIFEIPQQWQSGFSKVYSNCCCSCSFEPEIIKVGQSSHKIYSNNIEFSRVYDNLKCLYKNILETNWMPHVHTLKYPHIIYILYHVHIIFHRSLLFLISCLLKQFIYPAANPQSLKQMSHRKDSLLLRSTRSVCRPSSPWDFVKRSVDKNIVREHLYIIVLWWLTLVKHEYR